MAVIYRNTRAFTARLVRRTKAARHRLVLLSNPVATTGTARACSHRPRRNRRNRRATRSTRLRKA